MSNTSSEPITPKAWEQALNEGFAAFLEETWAASGGAPDSRGPRAGSAMRVVEEGRGKPDAGG